MKTLSIILIFTIFITNIFARDITELSFGTDSTFEVITWNIEWFPKNGQTTVDYVSQIIQQLDVDIIAMQELDDTNLFDEMISELSEYTGFYESSWFAGLAYIYKTDTIEINDIYEIYTTYQYWNTFPRSPVVMDMNFNGENIFVINNHYKCCGDGNLEMGNTYDEEYRRYMANELLKEYIDTNLPDNNVIVLGDLNDILTDNETNNVFQMILDDTENYLFADIEIAQGSSENWSYPTWPSHIDHILITNELFDDFSNDNSAIQTIQIDNYLDGGWYEYDQNISDHRPVGLRLDFTSTEIANNHISPNFGLKNYPNPFNPTTIIGFTVPMNASSLQLQIYNLNGQLVEQLVNSKMYNILCRYYFLFHNHHS